MAEIEYAYKPQGPTLAAYLQSKAQRTIITGPLGSSKTNASCWKSFRVMLDQEPDSDGVRRTRGLAVRNTYPDLFGTTIKDWLEMFGDLGKFSKGGLEPPTHRLKFKLEDGTMVDAELIFLALDRPDHVKKLRGMQLTFAWLNEVKELMFPILEMVDLRIGRYPMNPTWYGMFGDTNAPDTDHWLYRLSEELKPEGWTFLKQPGGLIRKSADAPWELNPLAENVHNLPQGYYVKGAQGKSESWIKVNLANEYGFVADGKPVYPDYRDSVHCKDFELVKGLPVHIGLDFGLTPAAIFGQRMVNGQWRWRHELVTTDTGVIRFANDLKTFIRERLDGFTIGKITGDPAGDQRQAGDSEERTVFQLLDANGIKAEPAHTNDFAIRTEAVANPLRRMIDGEPGFLIHSDCKVTRKGMQGAYKFRRMQIAGEERYRDVPEKNAQSHPCFVAGTLINTPKGARPIESLAVGDLVDTPIGHRRIVFCANREAEVFTLRLTNRIEITCTKDHPFYTQRGYVRAEALQYSDLIGKRTLPWKILFWLTHTQAGLSGPSLSSEESGTTGETATTRQQTATTYTAPSGLQTLEKSLLGGTSITKTRTHRTTKAATWNVCRLMTMALCTWKAQIARLYRGATSAQPLQPLLCGERTIRNEPQRLEGSVPRRFSRSSPSRAKTSSPAHGAHANTTGMPIFASEGSAAQAAKAWPARHQVLTTLMQRALSAAIRFARIATHLGQPVRVSASAKPCRDRVFNIEVEGAHCYFANGALVSNCEAGQYLMLGGGEGTAAITVHSPEKEEAAKTYREIRGLAASNTTAAAFRRMRGIR